MCAIVLLLAAQTFLWPWHPHGRHHHRPAPNIATPEAPDCAEINAWVRAHSAERYERALRSATKEQQKIITDCEAVRPGRD
jgi:hypothetical protein